MTNEACPSKEVADVILNSAYFQENLFGLVQSNAIPVMTKAKFAKETGLDELSKGETGYGVVDGLIHSGQLPSVKLGKHRLVDMVAFRALLIDKRG